MSSKNILLSFQDLPELDYESPELLGASRGVEPGHGSNVGEQPIDDD